MQLGVKYNLLFPSSVTFHQIQSVKDKIPNNYFLNSLPKCHIVSSFQRIQFQGIWMDPTYRYQIYKKYNQGVAISLEGNNTGSNAEVVHILQYLHG